jgi:mono/diheme cytochrome c family protein
MGAMNKAWLLCVALAVTGCKKNEDQAPPKAAPTAAQKAAAAKSVETAPPPPPDTTPDPKLVERGAYLAKATGCVVCHTALGPTGPDLEHAFAGGLEMPDPAGTWRTPNITQDHGTGIGGWTDNQIAEAIREGVRPDGRGLFAIMPFMSYATMTDPDVKALVAFLRTIKPIKNLVAPNKDLKMMQGPPPNLSQLAAARTSSDAAPDDPKHGGYMATLMLCAHCHWTPDATMKPSPDKMFSGGFPFTLPMMGTGTLYAANITSDPETGIGKWTEDQIFKTIKTMTKPDGKMIQGPMLFLQSQWSQLDDKDLHAVAAFIKQLPAVKNKVAASMFKPNAH